jgi:Fe2+ transport system protein FeoA
MKLSELEINKTAAVKEINCEKSLKSRLNDLGMYEGSKIIPVLKSPFKEPRAYLINGSLIALRKSDCDKITVVCNE